MMFDPTAKNVAVYFAFCMATKSKSVPLEMGPSSYDTPQSFALGQLKISGFQSFVALVRIHPG